MNDLGSMQVDTNWRYLDDILFSISDLFETELLFVFAWSEFSTRWYEAISIQCFSSETWFNSNLHWTTSSRPAEGFQFVFFIENKKNCLHFFPSKIHTPFASYVEFSLSKQCWQRLTLCAVVNKIIFQVFGLNQQL